MYLHTSVPSQPFPHCSFPCHNKSCDYKQIHTLWLSQTCSISWRGNLWKAVKHHFGSNEMVWMSCRGKWHGSHQASWQAAQFSSFQTSLTSSHTSLCERNQVWLSTKHTNINKTNTLAQRYKDGWGERAWNGGKEWQNRDVAAERRKQQRQQQSSNSSGSSRAATATTAASTGALAAAS